MKEKETALSAGVPWCYRFIRLFFYLFYRLVYRLSYEGLENVPLEGGVIIAPNHASLLDPPAVGCVIPRMVSYLAKRELFSVPFVAQILRCSNSIPIDRGGYSKGTILDIVKRLKEGRCCCIFPEGTRSRTGEFNPPKKGIGMIAVMADVPVVPCWIEGSFRAKPFRTKITLHYLPPIKPSECAGETKKDHYVLVSEKIMCNITSLYKSHHGRA